MPPRPIPRAHRKYPGGPIQCRRRSPGCNKLLAIKAAHLTPASPFSRISLLDSDRGPSVARAVSVHTIFALPEGTDVATHYVSARSPRRHRVTRIALATAAASAAIVATARHAGAVASSHTVRIGYVVPSNRTAQPNAVEDLRAGVLNIQSWYAEQMDRYGFGPKTFTLEPQSPGVPRVHVVNTGVTDATIRTDTWGQTISAASAGGLSTWTSGQVWLLMPESHTQQSNGAVTGGTALGASFGSGSDAGVSVVGGDYLFRFHPNDLLDTRPYGGMIEPRIGPLPLVTNVSFPSAEGNTISSIASAAQGATAHELGHAFGLAHDFRNDENARGVLMGNGLRGFRGSVHPGQFNFEDTHLSYAAALALDVSRYFNPGRTYTEDIKPSLAIQPASAGGTGSHSEGKLRIRFSASDASGLSAALLRRNGDTIGELDLTGGSVNTEFLTPYYEGGRQDRFTIAVYDNQGNVQSQEISLLPDPGPNQAPIPFIRLSKSVLNLGEPLLLDASRSSDPDGLASALSVQWDLNNDGVFDTNPTTAKTFTNRFDTPGTRLITARLADPDGAWSISTPMAIRVVPEPSCLFLAAPAILLLRRARGRRAAR